MGEVVVRIGGWGLAQALTGSVDRHLSAARCIYGDRYLHSYMGDAGDHRPQKLSAAPQEAASYGHASTILVPRRDRLWYHTQQILERHVFDRA